MSKNIEINIATSSNTYETLYPKTDYNILLNKPTIPTVPSLPLSVSNGGTGVTSTSSLANNLKSYFSYYTITSFVYSGTSNWTNVKIPKLLNRSPSMFFVRQYPDGLDYQYYYYFGPFILNDYTGSSVSTPVITINTNTNISYRVNNNSDKLFEVTSLNSSYWQVEINMGSGFFYKVSGNNFKLISFY